ncbi:SRPBCC family protein [Devosia lacusdianchii]|jgi:uncharacterized protein YndB with AHSA1/START domain|uniref:SRPBCC family protein n=1 Tax=Devosia lacusdianchii TaxID=2917991 RepID=UPI001F056104|nr:SRPBCC domain-containing protein [Devosia sp. JXJ CY 41]
MTDTIEAKVTHRFKASPERVYDAFLDPDTVRQWQVAWLQQSGLKGEITACEIDPVVGGKFLYADMREDGEARHWGTFKALHRPSKIAFTWITDPSEEDDPSVVTVIIEPEPNGSGAVVTLYHEMDAQWAEYIPQTEKGWTSMLLGIDEVLLHRG